MEDHRIVLRRGARVEHTNSPVMAFIDVPPGEYELYDVIRVPDKGILGRCNEILPGAALTFFEGSYHFV